jgi:hypothetical protein
MGSFDASSSAKTSSRQARRSRPRRSAWMPVAMLRPYTRFSPVPLVSLGAELRVATVMLRSR